MKTFSVLFHPWGKQVKVAAGETILQAALSADIPLDHVCGGCCSCTTCHVVIRAGHEALVPACEDERERLEQEIGSYLKPTSRLGCQTEVHCDLVVEVP